jgi:hypothetical protein
MVFAIVLGLILQVLQTVPYKDENEYLQIKPESVTVRGGEESFIQINIIPKSDEIVFHPEDTPPAVSVKSAPKELNIATSSVQFKKGNYGHLIITIPVSAEGLDEAKEEKIELEIEVFYCHDKEGWCRKDPFTCTITAKLLVGGSSKTALGFKILAVVLCAAILSCALLRLKLFIIILLILTEGVVLLSVGFLIGQHTEAYNIASQL